jgi:hypothetical protein
MWKPGSEAKTRRLPVLLALLATLVVHAMVLRSGFQDDDFLYLYDCAARPLRTFVLEPFGNHYLATIKLVWAGMYAVAGLHERWYFLLALITHLLHVGLLFGIVRALTRQSGVAALIAGAWGTAPALQGTLSWFSAYGMVLSGTFVLLPLYEVARASERRALPGPLSLLRCNVASFLGAGTMLGGSVTAVILPITAWLLMPRVPGRLRAALWLAPASLATILAVVLVAGSRAAPPMSDLSGAIGLFVELVLYGIGLTMAGPLVTLHADGHGMGLLEGPAYGPAVAVSAIFALPLLALLAVRLIRGSADDRRPILGLLLLTGSIYAAVAVGRSWQAAPQGLAWVATRDRYHYASNLGLVAAIGVALGQVLRDRGRSPTVGRFAGAAVAVALAAFVVANNQVAARTYMGRQAWARRHSELLDAALTSMVARAPAGTAYIRDDEFMPTGLLRGMGVPLWRFPGIGGYWVIAQDLARKAARPVRFIVDDASTLAQIREYVNRDVGALFATREDALRAGSTVLTVIHDAPPEAALALSESIDPLVIDNLEEIRRQIQRTTDPRVKESIERATREGAALHEAVREKARH